jgi:hypothetical protein
MQLHSVLHCCTVPAVFLYVVHLYSNNVLPRGVDTPMHTDSVLHSLDCELLILRWILLLLLPPENPWEGMFVCTITCSLILSHSVSEHFPYFRLCLFLCTIFLVGCSFHVLYSVYSVIIYM